MTQTQTQVKPHSLLTGDMWLYETSSTLDGEIKIKLVRFINKMSEPCTCVRVCMWLTCLHTRRSTLSVCVCVSVQSCQSFCGKDEGSHCEDEAFCGKDQGFHDEDKGFCGEDEGFHGEDGRIFGEDEGFFIFLCLCQKSFVFAKFSFRGRGDYSRPTQIQIPSIWPSFHCGRGRHSRPTFLKYLTWGTQGIFNQQFWKLSLLVHRSLSHTTYVETKKWPKTVRKPQKFVNVIVPIMAHLHCRKRTRVRTRTQILVLYRNRE